MTTVTTFLDNYYPLYERCITIMSNAFTPTAWKKDTAYSFNDLIKATNPNTVAYFRCISSGVSGAVEPTWQTGFWQETTSGTAKFRQEDRVYVLRTEPADFSYPCIVLPDIRNVTDVQLAMTNNPLSTLRVDLQVQSYMGTPTKKTYEQTRAQTYDIMSQVKNIIKKDENRNLQNFTGVKVTKLGTDTIPENVLPVFYDLYTIWFIELLTRKTI